jgi:hypothetical protein
MARKDKGHYAKKHPSDREIDQKVAEAVKGRISEEEISCAAAFKIVSDLEVSPLEVGFTIDVLEIPVTKCQLGLFGYNPQKKRDSSSRLNPCHLLWKMPFARHWSMIVFPVPPAGRSPKSLVLAKWM